LRAAARTLGLERAAQAALIEEMWAEVVGDDAAAHSRPVGLRGRVLLADAEGSMWAQELSAQRMHLAMEINRRLGADAVSEIRFRQMAPRPALAEPTGPAAAPGDEPTAEEIAAVERAAAEIADPEVRAAARKAMLSQVRWRKRHVRPSGR